MVFLYKLTILRGRIVHLKHQMVIFLIGDSNQFLICFVNILVFKINLVDYVNSLHSSELKMAN